MGNHGRNPPELLPGVVMKFVLDFYRMMAALLDWRCHLRILSGKGKYDVAFINFSGNAGRPAALSRSRKKVTYSLRFSLGSSLCRDLLLNCGLPGPVGQEPKQFYRHFIHAAIMIAVRDGARIILLPPDAENLFSESQLASLRKDHPHIILTAGGNGTTLVLLADMLHAIKLRGLETESRIAIAASESMGEAMARFMQNLGYFNLLLLDPNSGNPFDNISGVELLVICNIDAHLKLSAPLLEQMASPRGICLIDACMPGIFSAQGFLDGGNLAWQDAGRVFNSRIRYVFPWLARFISRRSGNSARIIYASCGEAVALSLLPQQVLQDFDFLRINTPAMSFIEQAFKLTGFTVSPARSFGEPRHSGIPATGWNIFENYKSAGRDV